MFFNLLYIHLFRPFLKYNPTTSPLPNHVSPRKFCTQAASSISKLMRLYKRTYGLRQICNIAVYIVHSACTIHLLNLPAEQSVEKSAGLTAKRDIVHGVKHLEEIAECWPCARRTLSILSVLARKWGIELPEEAATVLKRTDARFGFFSTADVPSPRAEISAPPAASASLSATRPQHYPLQIQPIDQAVTNQQQQGHIQNVTTAPYATYAAAPSMAVTKAPHGHSALTSADAITLSNAVPLGTTLPYGVSPIQSPRLPSGTSVSSLPPDSAVQLNSPYSTRHHGYSAAPNAAGMRNGGTGQQSNTNYLTRQTSPSALFGGVDSLVESQDWWLRDQASLAIGFENWGDVDNGEAAWQGLGNAGAGAGGGVGNPGFSDEDWYS